MHLRVFLSLTISKMGLKEQGTYGAREYENYTDCTLGTPSWWDTLRDTDITHLAFGVVRHKSPSVGEIGKHPATGAIRTKDGAGSTLLKKELDTWRSIKKEKKRRIGHMKVQEKENKKEREKYRKKESESELGGSTWIEAALYECLQACIAC